MGQRTYDSSDKNGFKRTFGDFCEFFFRLCKRCDVGELFLRRRRVRSLHRFVGEFYYFCSCDLKNIASKTVWRPIAR